MKRRAGFFILILAALQCVSMAQNPRLEFEVASVKPNNSGSGNAVSGLVQGSRFSSTNVTLMQMVRTAYGVQEYQVSGHPRWFESERFDIEAKIPAGAKEGDWQQMFQSLLADRFKLALHRETKDMTALALVIGRGGSKLKPADPSKCSSSNGCGFRASPSEIIGTSVSMSQFAVRLSRSLGRPVIDKTALDGAFDVTLKWMPEQNVPLGPGATASPEIFAAIQDQLGLRLDSTKAPVEALVIDRVERPSAN